MQQQSTQIGLTFIHWYLVRRPAEIFRAYTEYAQAFGALFSFIFLLKTLLAPWKSIRDEYPTKGFNLQEILQTFTLNVTARVIGLIFRVCAMIAGLLLQVALLAGFLAYELLWLAFPALLVVAVPFLIYLSF